MNQFYESPDSLSSDSFYSSLSQLSYSFLSFLYACLFKVILNLLNSVNEACLVKDQADILKGLSTLFHYVVEQILVLSSYSVQLAKDSNKDLLIVFVSLIFFLEHFCLQTEVNTFLMTICFLYPSETVVSSPTTLRSTFQSKLNSSC